MRTPIFVLLFTVVSACAGEVVAPAVTPVTPTSQTAASTRTHQLTVDGVVRTYIVYAPSAVTSTQRLPVVFMLHGTSGDGLKFLQISEWKEKCEAVKCIAVFPSSLEYCIIEEGVQKRTTKWHTGDLDRVACSGQTLADDVKFFRAMNTALATNYSVEPKKIYVSGFSNGAAMASLLWAAASDLLAGVASSAGFHSDSTIVSTSRVPLFFTIGEMDDNLSATVGFSLPLPLNASLFDIGWFRLVRGNGTSRLGLSSVYTTTTNASGVTFHFATPASANAEMYFWIVKGLSHQYANGTNYPLRYADVFWNFFAKHSR